MFDDKIFNSILACWIADQNHPHRGRRKKAIPPVEILKILIEESYLASLQTEEGCFNEFSLTFISKEILDSSPEDQSLIKDEIMEFDSLLDFNAESITKLSSGFDPNNSSILVECDDSGELNITGVIFYHSRENWILNQISYGIEGLSQGFPDLMMINCYSPGSFKILRGDSVIGRFMHGQFTPSIPTPFYTEAMGNFIIDSLKKNKQYVHPDNWPFFRDSLIVLLKELSRRAHGASVVFIPYNSEEYIRDIQLKYRLHDKLKINTLKELILSPEYNLTDISRLGNYKHLFERLKYLAQLSCLDGALILDTDFSLIGFGSTLAAPKWQGKVIVGPDGFGGGGDEFVTRKYGTRHNSMVDFIGHNEGCFGFVLSHDGPIRGFYKVDKDTILCWPDCTLSMFAD